MQNYVLSLLLLILVFTPCHAQFESLYFSKNLDGHTIFAECNPGNATHCDCDSSDVALTCYENYGEVTSNVNERHTYVNAIGYKKFVTNLPNNEPITLNTYKYTGQFKLPVLASPDTNQTLNPESIHMMIQLWDGSNLLYESNQHTLEGSIYWDLNPWKTNDYGKIKVYTYPLVLDTTGITIQPDTSWHTFEMIVDFKQQTYVSITIDSLTKDIGDKQLAQVHHADWGSDVSMAVTTESMATWPQENCAHIFKWSTRYKDLKLFVWDPEPNSIAQDDILTADEFSISPNFPNPFNPSTTLTFDLPRPGHVNLTVYNVQGQKVKELMNAFCRAGSHQVVWDGKDESGKSMVSGVYFCMLKAGDHVMTRRMVLMR